MLPAINTFITEIEGSTLQVANPTTGLVSQSHLLHTFTT